MKHRQCQCCLEVLEDAKEMDTLCWCGHPFLLCPGCQKLWEARGHPMKTPFLTTTDTEAREFISECARGAYPDSDKASLMEWVTERAKAVLLATPPSGEMEPKGTLVPMAVMSVRVDDEGQVKAEVRMAETNLTEALLGLLPSGQHILCLQSALSQPTDLERETNLTRHNFSTDAEWEEYQRESGTRALLEVMERDHRAMEELRKLGGPWQFYDGSDAHQPGLALRYALPTGDPAEPDGVRIFSDPTDAILASGEGEG